MNSYLVTIKIMLEVDAVDQEMALELAEDAVKRTRFAMAHKMVNVKDVRSTTAEEQHNGTPQSGR